MILIKNLLERTKLIVYILVIVIAFLVFALAYHEPQVSIKPVRESQLDETQKLLRENQGLRERLARLEPVTPVKIVTAHKPSTTAYTLPAISVMAEGTMIPFTTVYHDNTWVRPDYEPYWHSNTGQWSNLPGRIRSSYHRLFVTLGTKSLWNETIHESGIAELADQMKLSLDKNHPGDTIAVVALQHEIFDVVVLNNQVILIGAPSRTGVQVLAIQKQDLVQSISGELEAQNASQEYLFQLITPDGYEIDYSSVIVNF